MGAVTCLGFPQAQNQGLVNVAAAVFLPPGNLAIQPRAGVGKGATFHWDLLGFGDQDLSHTDLAQLGGTCVPSSNKEMIRSFQEWTLGIGQI